MISIIIPCYNASKTIVTALKSLENQINKNFEVIIINDGSQDDTEIVIKEYIKESLLSIRYFKQGNKGVSSSRNLGINLAIGNYICFLDADDMYLPDFTKTMEQAIEQNNVDVAYCYFTKKNKLENNNKGKIDNDCVFKKSKDQIMDDFMYKKYKLSFCTFIYRRNIIEENKIIFPMGIRYGEDLEFAWKYLSNCNNGNFVNKELYIYINNPISVTNKINWSKTDSLIAMNNIVDYLQLKDTEYVVRFVNYMYARVIWSIAKDFALINNKQFYKKFINEYEVKKNMKLMLKTNQIYVKISAISYLLNPAIFYYIIHIRGKFMNTMLFIKS